MGELVQHGQACPDCGSSDARAEYTDNWYCFSCEKSTLKRKKFRKSVNNLSQDVVPPRYKRMYIHPKAKDIIEKAHLSDQLIDKYNIHFTDDLEVWSKRKEQYFSMGPRMIIPHPGGFEARTLVNDSIKYVTVGHKDCLFIADDWPKQVETLTIVEDIFSAIRVGEFTPCVALMGTNLTKTKEAQLRTMSKNFIIWLDNDKAGRTASWKIKDRVSWFANDVIIRRTKRDPKCYTDDELEDMLDE